MGIAYLTALLEIRDFIHLGVFRFFNLLMIRSLAHLRSDLLRNLYRRNPRIGDISFSGYKVTEELDINMLATTLATFTVLSSLLFRIVFGDWQTAFGASTLVISVLGLSIQWVMYIGGET